MGHEDATTICLRSLRAFELIGRRWTGAILLALSSGAERFSMLRDAVPGLSDRMLLERLKELEAQGIVRRTVVPTTPVTIVYRLTEKGAALRPVLDAVGAWAHVWLPANPTEDATDTGGGATAV